MALAQLACYTANVLRVHISALPVGALWHTLDVVDGAEICGKELHQDELECTAS